MRFDFLLDPEISALDREIRRLEERREALVANKLTGRGIEYVTDPTVPEGELRFVDGESGEVKAVIRNVGF